MAGIDYQVSLLHCRMNTPSVTIEGGRTGMIEFLLLHFDCTSVSRDKYRLIDVLLLHNESAARAFTATPAVEYCLRQPSAARFSPV